MNAATTPERAGTNGLAIGSLVLGILGLITTVFGIGVLLALIAIIIGHIARSQIGRSDPRQEGAGLALGGLVLGYVSLLAAIALIAWAFSSINATTVRAKESKELSDLRQVGLACMVYCADQEDGSYPDSLEDLVPDYLGSDDILTDRISGKPLPITYAGAGKTESSLPDDAPLLERVLPSGRRLTVHADGRGTIE